MFTRGSPLKRKHNEFHDPDYPQQEQPTKDDDGQPGCSANFRNKIRKCGEASPSEEGSEHENYLHKVRHIIEREFQREILMKQQQLEEIDERLEKAKRLLDRLRYGIVLAYYKKQEIPLTAADAATLKGPNYLFEREEKGPQMPLHPSIKKLIGKKPRDIREVMRACPKRTAAQNAVHTIRAKSQAQKREERKLKKIIRNQGIVIDHSKQNNMDNDVNALLNAAAQNTLNNINASAGPSAKLENPVKEIKNIPSGESLNSARLNNKIKHFIVVGNTSKYIGNELEMDINSHSKNLTYKWLVYVQSKNAKEPIERFIKKVRFYLHHSYRPNDVIDIESPPFQISRRGWGEFPVRVQLFFHSELHQKPVQLIHNIVLDKTLSGIQTLGAETLLEIWLRDVKIPKQVNNEIKEKKPETEVEKPSEISPKLKTEIIPPSEELVDENLLDFLNKIEASPCSISADIEKIQPTVVVNEPFRVKINTPSPEKTKVPAPVQQNSPLKIQRITEATKPSETSTAITLNSTINSIDSAPKSIPILSVSEPLTSSVVSSDSIPSKPMTTFLELPCSSTQGKCVNNSTSIVSNVSKIPPLRPIPPLTAHSVTSSQPLPSTTQKPTIILKDGKNLMPSASVASAVRRTILPIVTSVPTKMSQSSQNVVENKPQITSVSPSAPTISNVPKQILQKKLVQLVDSTGKIKYIQMLVATKPASSTAQNLKSSSIAPKLTPVAPSVKENCTVTTAAPITNTATTQLQKSSNSAYLMPIKTMKPNIFKIVPENMQTKPQILTFSTSAAATAATTHTTANSHQKLQHSITPNAPTVAQLTAPVVGKTTLKGNNIINAASATTNKLQKPNVHNITTVTKNVVFPKEGKLYIIDPQQMKYKQQQKKQVSLLKPQISLLKQQQQQKLSSSPTSIANSIINTNNQGTATHLLNSNVSRACFGLKQQRINTINALQFMQMKRMVFEKQFLRQEFSNMRTAVEFLLRRLKLVVLKDSIVSDFPFVSHSLQEFQSLTAFKQRACEWLRAKNISQLLRNHKELQRLHNSSKEIFWSTKEIATFARLYAYTPCVKSLPRPGDQQQDEQNSSKAFMDLVKNELKQENSWQYDTLTDHGKVRKWVDKTWLTLEAYEHHEDHHQIIDVDGVEEEDKKKNKQMGVHSNTTSSHLDNSALHTYLAPPPHLESQCQLISDICKSLNIKLTYEELEANVYVPTTQTVLAQCLHLFIEKVLRQAIAFKQGNRLASASPAAIESICPLMPQDFIKILSSNSEFDFLTNNNFGSVSLAECSEIPVKQETP